MSTGVAVIVVSYETRELLDRCLVSLRDEALEVWVVDNASRDGSAAMVRDRHPDVNLIASDENLGFGRAVNLAAAGAQGHWLIAANADVALRPGAIGALLQAAARDGRAGVFAPRLVLPDGTTQHSVHPFPTLPFTVAFSLGLPQRVRRWADRLTLEGFWDPARPRRVDWAVGAFLLVRREAFEAVGGFDERQWMYAEDLDLGWRLARAGWRTRYVPEALVDHTESASTRNAFSDRTARWMQSTYAWMLRRRGPLRTRVCAAVNVCGATARAALLTRAARRGGPAAARRADLVRWARLHRVGLRPLAEIRSFN